MLLNDFYWTFFISFMFFQTNAEISSSGNVLKVEQTMLTDIENAFKGITNITAEMLHDKIIPEMYNLKHAGHKFIFKVPDIKSEMGFVMISTDRSELMPPIFPNLTLSPAQMALKKRRLQSTVRNSEGTHSVKPSVTNANVWSSLGLDGWSGELTNATDILELAHKDSPQIKINKNGPTNVTNLHNTQDADDKTDAQMDLMAGNFSSNFYTNSTDLSDNIYIARVNDPFGLSTKWSYRNQTNLDNAVENTDEKRQKRDIVELYSMLKCATGCEPLTYQSYGCYCGFLGNGIAVDGIDRCCRMHDKCYEQTNCLSYLQYFVPYVWKCYLGKPLCAIDHGAYGGPTSCAALLCYCDTRLSICLRKYQCPARRAVCTTSIARKLQNLFF